MHGGGVQHIRTVGLPRNLGDPLLAINWRYLGKGEAQGNNAKY